MVQMVKAQFYIISVLAITIILLPILIASYSITFTKIEKSPERVRASINLALKAIDTNIVINTSLIPVGDRDIVLAIETSGGTGGFFPEIKNGTKKFFDCADVTDKVLLFQFPYCPSKTGICNCNVSALTPFLQLTEENKTYLKSVVDSLTTFGKTPITFTLAASGQLINQTDPKRNRVIILLAAQSENCGGDPCAIVNSLIPPGVPVHTIGYKTGSAAETELKCIANKTDGQHYNPTTGDDLNRVFCEIGEGQEPRVTDFLKFVNESLYKRLFDLDFNVSYTLSLSAEITRGTQLEVKYLIRNFEEPIDATFNYTVYENQTILTQGTESFLLSESYIKEVFLTLKNNTNYTSISYLKTFKNEIRNEVTLPFNENKIKLEVKNLLVSYTISSDGTFLTESVNLPVYILRKY